MSETVPPYRYAMFTKHLQSLPLAEAGRTIKDLGFDGADLTVRPGGFVATDRVSTELPKAIRTLHDCGLEVPLLTTAITSIDDPDARPTFETAAELGIREIKLGYVKYSAFGTYRQLMDQAARDLDGIEKLAARTGVRASLHLHSEGTLTALAPVVWWLIRDRDPRAIGAYVDPGHMCVEGGGEGWRMGLDLLKDRISLVAIKDLTWERIDDPTQEKGPWISKIVPLSEGMVPWSRFFQCLRATGYSGWLSLHSEYQGWRSWKQLRLQELIEQTYEDLRYLKGLMREFNPTPAAFPMTTKS